ncbi:pirin family protein [uncultured Roseibium sp.]|uniref:pirin family protein n=1 Tax=uncultured Roseibium sp. TaxID=1936171 RepID=UPI00321626DB
MSIRPVTHIGTTQSTLEGAGVKLERAFGFQDPEMLDPFLLLDDFRNERPEDYLAGFPWHPHRGIETITYVLAGTVDHGDSLGNSGNLGAGDVQWMTAGRGIMHQEMPKGDDKGRMHGFQLWANLPSSLKMSEPRYQDVSAADIPVAVDDDGTSVRVICGDFWGKSGPVDGIAADPQYLDVHVPAGVKKRLKVDTYKQTFAYVFEGSGAFTDASDPVGVLTEKELDGTELHVRDQTGNRTLVMFGSGDEIVVQAGEEGIRFLLVSGAPIKEPVAWHGPIVMNTREELIQAVNELRSGTFIR